MSFVNLVSGGLDSTLIGLLAQENGETCYPLFINYGQIAAEKEWSTCVLLHEKFLLPKPVYMDLSGFGKVVRSGLTDRNLHIYDDAFTPGRNLLFLLSASAYAVNIGADGVAIGLLHEDFALFPDQTKKFIKESESHISAVLGRDVNILTPLIEFTKVDVIKLAKAKGLYGTYSCHSGNAVPCGQCISCLEIPLEQ